MSTGNVRQIGRSVHTQPYLLALASGVMLAASFPPSPVYSFAYVALIPFLFLLETLTGTWRILRFSYLTLFIFHVGTLYWIGGFVVGRDVWLMIAGAAVLLFHPLFYLPVILVYVWVRKRLGLIAALVVFPIAWVSYEFSHSLSEFSFPWITLGNSQAYDLARMQLAEFTSVYGLSFLILTFNVLGFFLIVRLGTRTWNVFSRPAVTVLIFLVFMYSVPWLYGTLRIHHLQKGKASEALRVGLVQPNVNPYDKWNDRPLQLQALMTRTEPLASLQPDLIVWPETAIPSPILYPLYRDDLRQFRARLDSLRLVLLTGLPTIEIYDSANAPITANRSRVSGFFYDDFNSTALFVPRQPSVPVFRKIVLVPFAERIPYASTFRFLIEPLKWNVGIGMWGIGKDTLVFSAPARDGRTIRFSTMICYESVYPNFVCEFVRRGAEFLVIITNDSWWGNTSGAYQHVSYASFRAVENRRWIVRAANGGISGFVDPTGQIHQETSMYTSAAFVGSIESRNDLTFYTRNGDVFALICVAATALVLLITLIPQRKKNEAQ